jgi:uncharacterized membrane protein YjgN (DUF898 family)
VDQGFLTSAGYPVALPLVFKGKTAEYFRVWIVNTCLTLLTFGIFSAWAKVRKKRYLYAHTELAGVPFRYLAMPLPILKGRVLGAILLALWYAGTHFSNTLLVVVLAIGVVIAPWVLVRSAAFNARYSSYRGFTFGFAGTYAKAAGLLFTSGLLVIVTCGLGSPWAVARFRRFMVENGSFGGQKGGFFGSGGSLFYYYLAFAGALALVGLIFSGLGVATQSVDPAAVRWVVAGTYGVYVLGFAYLQARVGNALWRSTSLGPVYFRATFRARDFAWLYFSNAVLSVLSLGLLIPWATIRMFRYRVDHLELEQRGPLEGFVGDPVAAVGAEGAEVADVFDFDLSL